MKYTTFTYEMIHITKGFVTFNKYARNFNFHNKTKTALTLPHAILHCLSQLHERHQVRIRGLLEKYPTFGREKETGLLGALDT